MPFLLKYENVAWYDSGKVRILDRRVFPERRFVECETYQEVRQAVADMVTQSTGPYAAVAMGMALAARQSSGLGTGEREAYLKKAADELAHARPTTSNRYALITNKCASAGIAALESGQDPGTGNILLRCRHHERALRPYAAGGRRAVEAYPGGWCDTN